MNKLASNRLIELSKNSNAWSKENIKLKEQLKKQTKHSEKLSYKLANLKEVMQIILIDGYATESSINFNVMTGRHYFDLVKKVLNKQQ